MLARACKLQATSGKNNVSFVASRITKIDLPSNSADCIISNCVINLVPAEEKQLVFNEMFRLLRRGGRVAISDILAKKPLPSNIRENINLYVGCVAGAGQVTEYEEYLARAGFKGEKHGCTNAFRDVDTILADVLITPKGGGLNVYTENCADGCCSGATRSTACCASKNNVVPDLVGMDMNEWVCKCHQPPLTGCC